MVLLRYALLSIFSLSLLSCAKVQYLWEQGQGQVSLLHKSRPNEEVLADVRVPYLYKEKIKKIEAYKKFYFEYFEKKPGRIYSRTTLLEGDAVTYLVIASSADSIKAKEECFPVMGCFPYLGYFDKNSALKSSKKLEKQGWVTWVRPVYAYSTLGHLPDPILSSFFSYSDYELAEMIFHELFHTVFWVTDEVDLDENLAVYFSEYLAIEYFKYAAKERDEVLSKKRNYDKLMNAILAHVGKINAQYAIIRANQGIEDPSPYKVFFKNYLQENFYPEIEKKCQELGLKKESCWPLKREWNNASFAALMTYQSRGEKIAELHKKTNLSLKDFYYYLEKRYDKFKKEGQDLFADDLFSP